MCIVKHIRHSTHLANIPTVNILIKGVCVIKHPRQNTLTDVSANANTATTKNTTRINYLKNLVDIDGNGTDVDLTHWDVSHASNTGLGLP
jgi:hypothetical protein